MYELIQDFEDFLILQVDDQLLCYTHHYCIKLINEIMQQLFVYVQLVLMILIVELMLLKLCHEMILGNHQILIINQKEYLMLQVELIHPPKRLQYNLIYLYQLSKYKSFYIVKLPFQLHYLIFQLFFDKHWMPMNLVFVVIQK